MYACMHACSGSSVCARSVTGMAGTWHLYRRGTENAHAHCVRTGARWRTKQRNEYRLHMHPCMHPNEPETVIPPHAPCAPRTPTLLLRPREGPQKHLSSLTKHLGPTNEDPTGRHAMEHSGDAGTPAWGQASTKIHGAAGRLTRGRCKQGCGRRSSRGRGRPAAGVAGPAAGRHRGTTPDAA